MEQIKVPVTNCNQMEIHYKEISKYSPLKRLNELKIKRQENSEIIYEQNEFNKEKPYKRKLK